MQKKITFCHSISHLTCLLQIIHAVSAVKPRTSLQQKINKWQRNLDSLQRSAKYVRSPLQQL